MAEEGIPTRCWKKFKAESAYALFSHFFVSFAAGALDAGSLSRCISQDLHFLNAFAQAFELVADSVENDDDKKAIVGLRKSVLQIIQKNEILVQAWVTADSNNSISDATVKYRDLLLAIALGKVDNIQVPIKITTPFEKKKVVACTLAAIAPCMRFYSYVYHEIRSLQGPADSLQVYQKWINNYASRDFLGSTNDTEDLLGKLSTSLTDVELDEIENLYHQALKLQVEFFAGQQISQQSVVPFSRALELRNQKLTIFCDFDLTCSVFHSTAMLDAVLFSTFPPAKLLWDQLYIVNGEEVKRCLDNVNSDGPLVPGKNYDYNGLRGALEQVAEVEKIAIGRVAWSGIMKNINQQTIKLIGKNIVLQDGCRKFFQKILINGRSKIEVHVISYCWSSELIREAFSTDFDVLKVHSNELAFVTTGEIIKKVESLLQKLQLFKEVVEDQKSKGEHFTVYIGRDVGDLLCLLEADIGIVLNSSARLRKLGYQFGVKFVQLFPPLVEKQKELAKDMSSAWKPSPGTLYLVSSWAEIDAFICGL